MLKERIESNLRNAFAPIFLEVVDESHLHVGHDNHKPGMQTHFSVTLVSHRFSGLNRLERHRKVYDVLEGALKDGVHALRLKLVSPEESNEPVLSGGDDAE